MMKMPYPECGDHMLGVNVNGSGFLKSELSEELTAASAICTCKRDISWALMYMYIYESVRGIFL